MYRPRSRPICRWGRTHIISCVSNLKHIVLDEMFIRICCNTIIHLFDICKEVLVTSLQEVEQLLEPELIQIVWLVTLSRGFKLSLKYEVVLAIRTPDLVFIPLGISKKKIHELKENVNVLFKDINIIEIFDYSNIYLRKNQASFEF
jgi:hypothetical protein